MARVLINVPRTAARGEVITIRTLIQHLMETGYRPDANGVVAPRDIIRRFTCRYDGEVVFQAELSPAIAANPFLSFTTVATRSGVVEMSWEGDNGFAQTETRDLTVT
ncbi:thiosulfate oxidation carrier complex protein SoxZ [Roseomonas frigidaquae]|uniref:Thiosulfate oxidation carrier complex protein SoxZ n=1 Tax=Falsiroseomonas frigidaquae TaxID=487318 RepID=A0ABX1F4L2_9PROT|nr:thiosulfate oxidation carrier complex protein SoxZ [Falsiroseomonas frigidaquae]NKE47242.1 thiosulfate oxidation carrier complex protein SoxZ [Falsiroseomonas frigidaquae]